MWQGSLASSGTPVEGTPWLCSLSQATYFQADWVKSTHWWPSPKWGDAGTAWSLSPIWEQIYSHRKGAQLGVTTILRGTQRRSWGSRSSAAFLKKVRQPGSEPKVRQFSGPETELSYLSQTQKREYYKENTKDFSDPSI